MLHRASASADFLPTQRFIETKFGTRITATGVCFRLWAPQCDGVALKLEANAVALPMMRKPRGWFELEVKGIGPGALYQFVLADGTVVPDPASRFQARDVLGPSEVIDPRRYQWWDVGWAGRPWEEAVCYELHVGTFTPEGTYRAAEAKLEHLADLGVTAIQMMPVNDFPGRWNWGYDGALQFAPDAAYGRPDDLKAFIDAAHELGLMVLLDVVYNHFGPKGNFLPHYAPVLTEAHHTPWGAAINFDGAGSEMVRDLILANARYWLNEYHFDGLRLDAVHEMKDAGFNHLLHDLALQIRGSTDGRFVHLVVENEENDPEWLRRTGDLRAGLYDAQWNDDIHHLVDVALYGEGSNYRTDYAAHRDWLPRALATGFAFQGDAVATRHGAGKGAPSGDLPPAAFVSFIQNHDQIGNRLFGERIAALAPVHKLRAVAALYLLAPQIPLLFMGEEWGSTQPFLYFSDVDPAFAEIIARERLNNFGRFVLPEKRGLEPPDAMAESSFIASKLNWAERDRPGHAELLAFYRALLAVRQAEIVPRLTGMGGHTGSGEMASDGKGFHVRWRLGEGSQLDLVANLSDGPGAVFAPLAGARRLWLEGAATTDRLGPWSVLWTLAAPEAAS